MASQVAAGDRSGELVVVRARLVGHRLPLSQALQLRDPGQSLSAVVLLMQRQKIVGHRHAHGRPQGILIEHGQERFPELRRNPRSRLGQPGVASRQVHPRHEHGIGPAGAALSDLGLGSRNARGRRNLDDPRRGSIGRQATACLAHERHKLKGQGRRARAQVDRFGSGARGSATWGGGAGR